MKNALTFWGGGCGAGIVSAGSSGILPVPLEATWTNPAPPSFWLASVRQPKSGKSRRRKVTVAIFGKKDVLTLGRGH